jgi:hypothetical protein
MATSMPRLRATLAGVIGSFCGFVLAEEVRMSENISPFSDK